MPTIIDSLLIELGIDASKMSVGAKEATDQLRKVDDQVNKNKKNTEDAGKKMAQSIGKLRNELVAVLAIFTAGVGLKQFFQQMTSADAATGRLAKNIDTTVDNLTAWQGVAERSGGSAAGIAGSMQNLTHQFQQLALTGQSAVIPYFRAVGVAIADSAGHLRPLNDILLDVADKFKGMDPAKAQALGLGMGFDEGTVNVLMHGRAAIIALLAEQEKIGHANKADAEAAIKRQAALRGLAQASEDAGRKILTILTPAILQLTHYLTVMGEWFTAHPKVAATAVGLLTAAILALSAAMAISAVSAFASMAVAGVTAFTSITAAAWPVLGVIAALAGGFAAGKGLNYLLDKGLSKAKGSPTSLGGLLYDWTHKAYDPNSGQSSARSNNEPRGIRNNNPGNLNYAGQAGASLESGPNGRFAVFATMEQGIVALAQQLQRYASRGINTISGIISKYAPAAENNTKAYIAAVSKKLGIAANAQLNLSDDATLKALIEGITTMENGRGKVSRDTINSALSSRYGKAAGAGNNVRSEVHVGSVTVNTKATDASGIAKDMVGALNQHFYTAAMANYGLS